MISKFGSAAVFNMCYIDIVVLNPTILTPTFFGICNLFARLFASSSSIFAEVDHVTFLFIYIVLFVFASNKPWHLSDKK